jgi:hypothetical protein
MTESDQFINEFLMGLSAQEYVGRAVAFVRQSRKKPHPPCHDHDKPWWETDQTKKTSDNADASRLARLRADNLAWRALRSDAEAWDTTFLLGVIDDLSRRPNARATESDR